MASCRVCNLVHWTPLSQLASCIEGLSGSSGPFLSELLACRGLASLRCLFLLASPGGRREEAEAAEMGTQHDLSRYRRMACPAPAFPVVLPAFPGVFRGSIKYGSAGIDVIASIGGLEAVRERLDIVWKGLQVR